MKAAIYSRISDDKEGKALGVRRQETDTREVAKRHGWEIIEPVYSDNDISAVKERPDWNRLLKDITTGKIDAVVAYSSSRLYRDVDKEKGRLFKVCQDQEAAGHRVLIETVVSGMIDPYTADGRMLANIIASIDQGERERTRERVIRKRKEKADNGEFQGGYRPFGFEQRDRKLVPREDEARLIRRAASDLLSGQTVTSIARRWNGKGVRTTGGRSWSKTHVRAVLTAERNAPAILTPTDLRRVQELVDGRRTGRAPDRYLLTGLLICGRCGERMMGRGGRYICASGTEVHPKGTKWKDPKTGKVIDLSGKPKQVHLAVQARTLNEFVFEAAGERENERPAKRTEAHDPSEKLVQQREAIVAEQEQLGESDLPMATIRGRSRKLQRQLEEIDRQLDEGRPQSFWSEVWKDIEEWDQRAYIETYVESVTLKPAARRGVPTFDPRRVAITWRS